MEIVLDPALRGRPIAVCGSEEMRHGIVLAKSEQAKRTGVKTGMAIWEAKSCCPDLLVVPPHYDEYFKYSAMIRNIYKRYTGFIEPFGLDECWLDVTGITDASPLEVAEEIRRTTKGELGLTVSIGVSFNKIFAKLGSDMKKPDAITEIAFDSFREKVWPLPASELLGVGPATVQKLHMRSVDTIGELASTSPQLLKDWLGVNGVRLWAYANGLDESRVAPDGLTPVAKSVGHGMTTSRDMKEDKDVRTILLLLVPRISRKLRQLCLKARGVQISVRSSDLMFSQYQTRLPWPTQSTREIMDCAMELFQKKYTWHHPIRAFTVRAVNLISEKTAIQLDFFGEAEKREKQECFERAVDGIRERFGRRSLIPAELFCTDFVDKQPELEFMHMPSHMYS